LQRHSFAQGTEITLLQFLIFSWKQLVLDTSNYMSTNTFQTAEPTFTAVDTHWNCQAHYNSCMCYNSAALMPPSINTASKAGQEQQLHRKATQCRPALHLLYSKSLENTTRRTRRWEGTRKKTPACCNKKAHKETICEAEPEHETLSWRLTVLACLSLLFSEYLMKHKGTLRISRI